VIVHAELILRREEQAYETLVFLGASGSAAMEKTGLVGLRNLPASPGRTGARF